MKSKTGRTRKIFILAVVITMLINPVLTGITTHAAETAADVLIAVEGISDTILEETEVTVEPSNDEPTALDALTQALDAEEIGYELSHFDWGVMIDSIAGEAGGTFGGWDGWMYTVNGESPAVGAGAYILEPGDEVLFYYSRWASISTDSSIVTGDEDPVVTVNLAGDEFAAEAEAADLENWEIDTGNTGLTADSITKEDNQKATVAFTGTASAGTVSITVKAAALGGEADSDEITLNTLTATLSVEGITETVLPATEASLDSENGDPTALDLLEQVLSEEEIGYELFHFDWGVMIDSIAGEAGGTFGGWDGWMYTVNGESPAVGAGAYILEPGDEVLFYYSRWASISTDSSIVTGDEDPVVTVNLAGDEFAAEAEAADLENWEIDTGNTGLTADSITKEDNQKATVAFTGTASAGTVSITVKAAALGGEADSDEITLKPFMIGDVSESGTINVSDAVLVLRHIAGIEELSEEDIIRADVNRDGVVNIKDAVLILRYVVKLIDKFPDESPNAISEMIDDSIEKTVSWYNQNHAAPNSWEGLPALWGAGEDLNNDPWKTDQEWRETDPGFEADDEKNNHPQYILRLLAVQQNPADIWEGRNLFAELAAQQEENGSFGDLGKQIWSVIALDIGRELAADVGSWDEDSRQSAVNYLLHRQKGDGSFGDFSELDFTGWALTALSGYRGNSDVEKAIDDALDFLKSNQQETGGFAMEGEWGAENANSNAVVISGLAAVGEDILDPAGVWVKNGNNPLDALLRYQQEDGSFRYTEETEGVPKMSTVQALTALVDLKHETSIIQRMGQVFN